MESNSHNIWFKRKTYGWGWTPVTWQGWLAIFVYIILVVISALTLDDQSPTREVMFNFALPVALLTFALIWLAYKKGERPRWQWGNKK
ncbi:MAG: hypothetical protein JWL80_237 [Parcubacteria group bacterium]|nr:hypothetical protein [Parcubacteria group bacterium]